MKILSIHPAQSTLNHHGCKHCNASDLAEGPLAIEIFVARVSRNPLLELPQPQYRPDLTDCKDGEEHKEAHCELWSDGYSIPLELLDKSGVSMLSVQAKPDNFEERADGDEERTSHAEELHSNKLAIRDGFDIGGADCLDATPIVIRYRLIFAITDKGRPKVAYHLAVEGIERQKPTHRE